MLTTFPFPIRGLVVVGLVALGMYFGVELVKLQVTEWLTSVLLARYNLIFGFGIIHKSAM